MVALRGLSAIEFTEFSFLDVFDSGTEVMKFDSSTHFYSPEALSEFKESDGINTLIPYIIFFSHVHGYSLLYSWQETIQQEI